MSDSLLPVEVRLRSEGEAALLIGGEAARLAGGDVTLLPGGDVTLLPGGDVTLLPGEVILLSRRLGAGFFVAKDLGIKSLSSDVRWSTHLASKLSMSILQWSWRPQ